MSDKGFFNNLFGSKKTKPKTTSAARATERLRVIVESEHRLSHRLNPEKIEQMKREILDVVNKFVRGVNIDDVNIQHRSEANVDMLEMNINLPDRR